jgi:hypothetical protein
MKWDGPQVLALVGVVAGIYVVLVELPFLATRSSLAPALTGLAIGVAAVGMAILLDRRQHP